MPVADLEPPPVPAPVPRPAQPRPAVGSTAGGPTAGGPTAGEDRPGDDRDTERGLRGLLGGGSSQVPVDLALRARDAARPTAEQLAAAEATLVIVRRGWTPPESTSR